MNAVDSRRPWPVYAAVFLLLLALSWLTPMVADDFSYCFSWADDTRVTRLGQILPSMAVHRQLTNGRVFTHGLVQLLLMAPKALFNLCNAAMALLLLALTERHFRFLPTARRALLLGIGALLLWDATPAFGQVFLWLDGAVNYGWGIVLFLLFLRPYAALWLEEAQPLPVWRKLLFLPLSFLVGTWAESAAPTCFLIALCLLLLSARRDRRVDPLLLLGLGLELLGIVFLMSAPATQGRASGGFDAATLANNIQVVLLSARKVMLPLLILWALSFAAALSVGADARRLTLSALYLLGGLCSLAAYGFAAYFADRHFCFAVCITALAELLLLGELLRLGRPLLPRAVAGLLAACFLFLFPLGLLDIGVTFKHSLEREAAVRAARAAGEKTVALEVYLPSTAYSAPYHLVDLYPDADSWPNTSVAAYYGFDKVYGVFPEDAISPD